MTRSTKQESGFNIVRKSAILIFSRKCVKLKSDFLFRMFFNVHLSEESWYLYCMVAQNMLRRCGGKHVCKIFKNA